MTVPAIRTDPRDRSLTVASDVLGPLTLTPDRLVRLPLGLLGLPDAREFVMIAADRDGVFWLQSTEHASLIFLLVDPFAHFPDYIVELSAADVASLEAASHTDVAIFAIVTLAGDAEDSCTANLQGPLAFNLRQRLGRQIILRAGDAGVRRPIKLD